MTKPSPSTPNPTDQLVTDFERLRPKLNAYTDKLDKLLRELISNLNIKPQSIEYRTKSVESFREKINRPGKNYTDPLKQITDLSGLRIIVHYLDDIEEISRIIESEFAIDTDASLDKRDSLAPNEFGYLSKHYIVSLKSPRTSLPEWSAYSNFKTEIQLRTVLQHAWAAIEHSLQYKSAIDTPANSRRRLFRLSGLLELADEEFNTLKSEQQNLKAETQANLDKSPKEIEINFVTLSTYISKSKTIEDLYQLALSVGFVAPEEIHEDEAAETSAVYISGAVRITQGNSKTIGDLDTALRRQERTIKAFFEEILKPHRKTSIRWITTKPFTLMLACCAVFPSEVTTKLLTRYGWNAKLSERTMKILKSSSPSTT